MFRNFVDFSSKLTMILAACSCSVSDRSTRLLGPPRFRVGESVPSGPALSLPLAKRDRLLAALKAFSMRYGQCSARKFPYSKLDEDRFVRGIEWAYANRQNDI